jgi:carnitine 3-dehydrogenase
MSLSRISLDGSVSTGARLCFAGHRQNAIQWSCRSSVLQRTVNRILTVCLSRGGNPTHIIPLVEVVGGAKTSEQTIKTAMAFYASIGKKPIRLFRALPGHVANRLQAALYKEVLYLIQQGVLSVEDADSAVSYGPGPRWGVMGPSLQWHLGGGEGGIHHFLEHLMDPMAGLMKSLGTPNVTHELKQMVADGVMQMARNRSVGQLADGENEVLTELFSERIKVGL